MMSKKEKRRAEIREKFMGSEGTKTLPWDYANFSVIAEKQSKNKNQ